MNDLSGQHPVPSSWNNVDDRLDSWKEIAAYLERTATTVKRWEKREGLPVHRHIHDKRGTVYASRSEIDTWLANRSRVLENGRPGWFPFSKSLKIAACVVVLLLAALGAYVYQSDELGFQDYSRSAYELVLRDGNSDRAKPSLDNALDLLTPEEFDADYDTAIALMWLPAFEALLGANPDPETALREADRSLEMLRRFTGQGFVNYQPTSAFYLTLGKIGLAREWSEKMQIAPLRHFNLAAIAYIGDDREVMTRHLQQYFTAWKSLRSTTQGPLREQIRSVTRGSTRPRARRTFAARRQTSTSACCAEMLLARGGFFSEAEEWFSYLFVLPGTPPNIREVIVRNTEVRSDLLTLSKDKSVTNMRKLQNALLLFDPFYSSAAVYLLSSEILAETWAEEGDLGMAARVLEIALEKRTTLLLDQTILVGPLWLRLQAQLAKLYTETGRNEEAREIEEDLRKRLALADPDHPILRQLDHTKDLALR